MIRAVFCLVIALIAAEYDSPVCSTDLTTYPTYADAKAQNATVMHCGNCGECSNSHDINIYKETRNTLTETSKNCAIKALFFGARAARACLNRNVGFTQGCLNCWVQNIQCTKQLCLKTCIGYFLFGIGKHVGKLDPCLACDEEKCGPGFAACAGANRRRCGIKSDIARPDEQVCKLVGL